MRPNGILQRFTKDVARAPSEHAVAAALMDHGPEMVGGHAVALYLLESPTVAAEIHSRGLQGFETMLEFYEERGRAADPLFAWVLEHQTAAQVSVEELLRVPSFQRVTHEVELVFPFFRQYMLAPVVLEGEVRGMIHASSPGSSPLDERIGSTISLHVSTRIAVLRSLDKLARKWDGVLDRREGEIADLAMRGLSVPEMGRALGISPNTVKKYLKALYAKVGVGSRIDLASELVKGPAIHEQQLRVAREGALAGARSFFYAA